MRFRNIAYAAALLVLPGFPLLVSCGDKKADPQAQTQTATLSGQIQPAGSVTAVTATDGSGRTAPATLSSTGAYSFAGLSLGNYSLSFTPAAGFVAPAAVSVSLSSGGTTVPPVTVLMQTATLSGQIQPAGAVATVTATAGNGRTYTATPTAAGTYAFPDLPLGTYTLSFVPVAGYAAPAPLTATLLGGGSTVPLVTAAVGQRLVSFQVDGQPIVPTHIYGSTVGGSRFYGFSYAVPGTGVPEIRLNLDELTPVVGTYSLNDPSTYNSGSHTNIRYTSYYSKFANPAGPASGTLTITSVNTTLRRFSGTFQFVAGNASGSAPDGSLPAGTSPTVSITNGIISNLFY